MIVIHMKLHQFHSICQNLLHARYYNTDEDSSGRYLVQSV